MDGDPYSQGADSLEAGRAAYVKYRGHTCGGPEVSSRAGMGETSRIGG